MNIFPKSIEDNEILAPSYAFTQQGWISNNGPITGVKIQDADYGNPIAGSVILDVEQAEYYNIYKIPTKVVKVARSGDFEWAIIKMPER